MIHAQGLSKRYPRRGAGGRLGGGADAWVQAVRGVDFTAADGRITGLLGANGAGKTTTLRMVTGLVRPDAGVIRVAGLDVAAHPTAVRARLGVLPDSKGLYPRLTARENIVYHARLHGMGHDESQARAEVLAEWLGLTPHLDRRAEGFSQGERMKTALARALVHDPSHLVLDEPTNGLDVLSTRALREVLRRLRDEAGQCIVLSSHVMSEVEKLCDQVVVIAGGRTVAQGSVAALCERAGTTDFETAFVRLAYAPPAKGENEGEGAQAPTQAAA